MVTIKTVYKIGILLMILLALSGCWDRKELEDNSYVIGLGLDKSKEKDKIKVTMLIANPEVGSAQGGGGSTEKAKEVISFDANDFITARSTANATISRTINYDLLDIIVVSEEFAKDPDFYSHFSTVLFDKEIRLDTYLAVSKEKASEYFLHNKPKMETRPHKYFQFMITHGIANGLIPDSSLQRFFKTTSNGTDLFLAMYTTTKKEKAPDAKAGNEYIAGQVDTSGDADNTQFIGSAVFKDGTMIDKLNGRETRLVNILDDTTNIEELYISIPDPFSNKQQLALKMLKSENNKVKMNLTGNVPKIFITVPLKFEVMSNPSFVKFGNNPKNQRKLREAIYDDFIHDYGDLFVKAQTELKGVPYPLSIYSRRYFGTIEEYEKFNWTKSFLKAEIDVKPEIQIIDYGKAINPIKGKGE